jgi:hypothetical protein
VHLPPAAGHVLMVGPVDAAFMTAVVLAILVGIAQYDGG